ncbi:hypothetical protein ACNKHS_24775 [Shigella flexneri]
MDGSQKLPQRSAGFGASAPAKRRQLASPALGAAGWMRYTQGVDEQGNAIDVVDPMLAQFQKINAQDQGADRVKALLGLSGIFADDSPEDPLCRRGDGGISAAVRTRCARVCGCAVNR